MKKSIVFGILGVLVFGSLTGCSSVGRQALREAVENVGGGATRQVEQGVARQAGQHSGVSVTKVVPYGAKKFTATVTIASGVYEIYGDCKTGIEGQNAEQLSKTQKANLVRDICSGHLR